MCARTRPRARACSCSSAERARQDRCACACARVRARVCVNSRAGACAHRCESAREELRRRSFELAPADADGRRVREARWQLHLKQTRAQQTSRTRARVRRRGSSCRRYERWRQQERL
eukprot:6174565-Pleurochrysis_carterae.AAC.2